MAVLCCVVRPVQLCRMVRLIAAGLVEVGHGRITPAQFKKALAAGDRSALPVEAAPPHGLYLEQVCLCKGVQLLWGELGIHRCGLQHGPMAIVQLSRQIWSS